MAPYHQDEIKILFYVPETTQNFFEMNCNYRRRKTNHLFPPLLRPFKSGTIIPYIMGDPTPLASAA
jgi:hypothetical protein